MNKVILKGTLPRKPYLAASKDGKTMVALFTVMCRRDPHMPADYVEVKAFNEEAIVANDRLTDGTEVEIHAFLRSESWLPTGKNAKRQYRQTVTVTYIGVLNGGLVVDEEAAPAESVA
jgi:single-stranded DNA-binding protein